MPMVSIVPSERPRSRAFRSSDVLMAGLHFMRAPSVSYFLSSNHRYWGHVSAVICLSAPERSFKSSNSSEVEMCSICRCAPERLASSMMNFVALTQASVDRMTGCMQIGIGRPAYEASIFFLLDSMIASSSA